MLGLRSIALVAYMTAEFAYASELVSDERAVSGVATLCALAPLAVLTGVRRSRGLARGNDGPAVAAGAAGG